ncbi:MAG: hypothetical protein JWP12_1766 [Bacteroidetes bacterium]|nr:hypothetical protein [Bacteroidota bacterium]
MKIIQKKLSALREWEIIRDDGFDHGLCNVVFAFGSRELLSDVSFYSFFQKSYPLAEIIMCSTSGEIIDTQVSDNTISLTGIFFERTAIKVCSIEIESAEESFDTGKRLSGLLEHPGLKHVMVISDGMKVNGTELVNGLAQGLPQGVIITGGLAGDGYRFEKTIVGANGTPIEGQIIAIGFYGQHIITSYGSVGGWGPFGPERLITKAKGNILFELDGKPALNIYKNYLGEYASELPGSGLLFPLSIRSNTSGNFLVRTILSINEKEGSLTFAGSIPEGVYARFMKASFNKLIEGAYDAAQNSIIGTIQKPDLAILISCVGRKLVLDQRVEEEIEVIRTIYGNQTAITGFYSYGEISPLLDSVICELHNQTMTITTFTEADESK